MSLLSYVASLKRAKINLALGENPFTPKIKLRKSIINKYMDSEVLKRKLSSYHGIGEENIAITPGSYPALLKIQQAVNGKILVPLPNFFGYEKFAKLLNKKIVFLEHEGFPYSLNINGLIQKIRSEKPSLVFISNPNNPTGEYIPLSTIKRILDESSSYIVVDEALLGFSKEHESAVKLLKDYNNLIVVKSFSKLYGLAGLRVGYLVSNSSLISKISKFIFEFEVSSISVDIAIQALKDRNHIKKSQKHVSKCLKLLNSSLPAGIKITPSSTLVALLVSSSQKSLYEHLLSAGISTSSSSSFRSLENENAVRITLGKESYIKKVVSVLNRIG